MLFVMTSGDLNIDLTQKKVVYKSCKSFNELSNALAVCRYDSCFSSSDGGQKRPPPNSESFRARPEYG